MTFESSTNATTHSEVILLVVADRSERSALSMALQSVGFIVAEAETGEEAEDLLGFMKVDLIITDLTMPKRDGLEILHAVKHDLPNLAVMVLFAILDTVQVVLARAALRLGARAILAK